MRSWPGGAEIFFRRVKTVPSSSPFARSMVATAAIAIYGAQDVRMEVQLSAPVTSVVRHALQECFGHPKDRAGAARPTPGSF